MAAVPAVAGMAAAVCLAPQALANPAPAHAAAHSATVSDALMSRDDTLAAVKRTALMAGQAQTVTYKVRSGDSLSAIAGKVYHKQNAWPVLYWANRDKIRWANVLGEGQVLKVPAMPGQDPRRALAARSGPGPGPARRPSRRPRPRRCRPPVRCRAARCRAATRAARPARSSPA